MHLQDDPDIEGVCRISADPGWPRPWLAVVGSLHGNEPCGVQALSQLRRAAQAGGLASLRGTLLLVHGNPEATRQGARFTEHGCDLNRLFDYAFEHELSADAYRYEHGRALALRPLVDDVDGLVDLHSSTTASPAFAIATELPASAALAARLGLDHVVRGWHGPGMLGHRVLLAPLDGRGVPSVAVECGQHDEPTAADVAHRAALCFLRALGGLPADAPAAEPPRWLRIHDAIRKPSTRFRFDGPIAGFDRLSQGRCIGHDGLIAVDVRGDCTAVLPNDGVDAGDDMLFLATDDRQPHP